MSGFVQLATTTQPSRCWHRQQPTIPRVNQSCFLFLSKVPPVGLERQLTFAIENSRNGVSRFGENDGNGNAGPKNALGHALRCVPLNFFVISKKNFYIKSSMLIDLHMKKKIGRFITQAPPTQSDGSTPKVEVKDKFFRL